MKSYNPSFQDRVASAAQAKQKALEQLRAKPPVDPAVAEERRVAREAKAARDQEKRAAKAAEAEAKAAAKAAEAAASAVVPPTEEEKKAARDARYAARKARK